MSSSINIPGNGNAQPTVCLITTVKNEAQSILALMESISRQSLAPSNIIVVDGGSTDGTLEVLEEWSGRLPLRVLSRPGLNISAGRNVGIRQADAEYIAVTDAGVSLDPDWLERLVAALTQDVQPVDVAAGSFSPDPRNEFETALAASTLPDVSEIDPSTFLPSSRSIAFRKSWFRAGIRYPEWLDYCEDIVFDLRLKQAGARFVFVPEAIARFRPRDRVGSFWHQYYRYARGDGKEGLFWKRHLLRYLTYLVVLPSVFVVRSQLWRGLVLLGAIGYIRPPVVRLWARSGGNPVQTACLAPLAALLRGTGDLAKMAGYPAGILWRARRYGLRRDWRTIPEPDET
ncbi:MAG: glycosyltransferase [Thermomicrobiaceae bacterium]